MEFWALVSVNANSQAELQATPLSYYRSPVPIIWMNGQPQSHYRTISNFAITMTRPFNLSTFWHSLWTLEYRHSPTWEVSSHPISYLPNFRNRRKIEFKNYYFLNSRREFFLVTITAQREGGWRILWGDNVGAWAVMLRPRRFQCAAVLSSTGLSVCTYTVDNTYTECRNVQNWTWAWPTA
jgi:hypothetical protein